jgi:hypothetical protein
MLSCFILAGALWIETDSNRLVNLNLVGTVRKLEDSRILYLHTAWTEGRVHLPEKMTDATVSEVMLYLQQNCK